MRPVIVICGPTASGKTAQAVTLAREFPIEIVSADSRQMIKHLDIGTAKPTAAERSVAPCHLIDLIEPGERYSAYRFIEDADRAIGNIIGRSRIPIIVGGTGLYLRAFSSGVVEIDEAERDEVRRRLQHELELEGAEVLYERLVEVDPSEAASIHPNNHVRLLRALEIFELTGESKSTLASRGSYRKSSYVTEFHCLLPEREALYRWIESRVDQMILDGWIDEVMGLVARGLAKSVRRADVIGYGEILDFVAGSVTLEEAVSAVKQAHRRYAKRQITWFRHQMSGSMYENPAELGEAVALSLKMNGWVS